MYCGRRLASALAMLCQDTVETVLVKRSGVRVDLPWLMPYRGSKLGRSKRQVVSECCDNPCTIDELLSYC
ncbi:Bombyxin A-4 [Papilio xuthus]|uniref:Bombyxin A-4 n=1 Tax=Papilio xuthus TaxID=66420 RepID=A0A194PZ95_PAPXU|nr:Bombyxin A-4 [Papilio xuthus]